MKLTPQDIGRTVAYHCRAGTGTARISSLGVRTIAGRSAFVDELTGPLAGPGWHWIHENCLSPINDTKPEE